MVFEWTRGSREYPIEEVDDQLNREDLKYPNPEDLVSVKFDPLSLDVAWTTYPKPSKTAFVMFGRAAFAAETVKTLEVVEMMFSTRVVG